MSKKDAVNLDVRFRNPEQEEILKKFKIYCSRRFGGGQTSERVRNLMNFDLWLAEAMGEPLDLEKVENLDLDVIKKIFELNLAYDSLGVSLSERLLELAQADIKSYRTTSKGLNTMAVKGNSLGDNLPQDPTSIKKILDYLAEHEIRTSLEDYQAWLLLSESNGFERGAKCPTFTQMVAIANYLFPRNPEDINQLGVLWQEDVERQKRFQWEKERKELDLYRQMTINNHSETLQS